MDKPLTPVFLLFHDALSTALLAAVSWQTFTAWGPRGAVPGFAPAARPAPLRLPDIVAGLFVIVILLGALLYPSYRFTVRPYLELHDMRAANGVFEIKEHFAALALLMLPAYLAAWHNAASDGALVARRVITGLLCAMVWWNFMVGHVLTYIQGPVS